MLELNELFNAALAETFAQQAVSALNRALLADPNAVQKLFSVRVPCNKELTNDPTIQVQADNDGSYTIGVLGLINGIIGTRPGTQSGFVASIVEGEKGVVVDDRVQRFEYLGNE